MKWTGLYFLTLLLTVVSCKKNNQHVLAGTYSGVFTVKYNDQQRSGITTLLLKKGEFSCTAGPKRYPAGGSGSFSVSKNKINFKDNNHWTTDFDGNLILNGTYDYTFDGKTLKIMAEKNGVGHYQYHLEKD